MDAHAAVTAATDQTESWRLASVDIRGVAFLATTGSNGGFRVDESCQVESRGTTSNRAS